MTDLITALRDLSAYRNSDTSLGDDAADEIERLREALLSCARQAEALKRECGMDPETAQAVRNAQYQAISTTAHIALGTIRGAVHMPGMAAVEAGMHRVEDGA